jgi:hypothetical protein
MKTQQLKCFILVFCFEIMPNHISKDKNKLLRTYRRD